MGNVHPSESWARSAASANASNYRLSAFSTKLPDDLQKSIKITCAVTDTLIQDAVREALADWVKKHQREADN